MPTKEIGHKHVPDYTKVDGFILQHNVPSLVPRPSLIAFFATVEKKRGFFHGCEKSCEGRPGYEARHSLHAQFFFFARAGKACVRGYKIHVPTST